MNATPARGARFDAPWGRYVVHRVDGDRVVLRELHTFTRYTVPLLAELAAKYLAVEPLASAAGAGPAASSPPAAAPPFEQQRCTECRRPRAVLVYAGDPGSGAPGYCYRCYGVSEEKIAAAAIGAIHTDWRPPPGELYESRAEVGSFESAPAGALSVPAPPEPPPPAPPRVKADEWNLFTREFDR